LSATDNITSRDVASGSDKESPTASPRQKICRPDEVENFADADSSATTTLHKMQHKAANKLIIRMGYPLRNVSDNKGNPIITGFSE
jgi:hypothetical protein